ncbi:MAG: hypothetical protein ABI876_01625 [Bacteroidota bacterium]
MANQAEGCLTIRAPSALQNHELIPPMAVNEPPKNENGPIGFDRAVFVFSSVAFGSRKRWNRKRS